MSIAEASPLIVQQVPRTTPGGRFFDGQHSLLQQFRDQFQDDPHTQFSDLTRELHRDPQTGRVTTALLGIIREQDRELRLRFNNPLVSASLVNSRGQALLADYQGFRLPFGRGELNIPGLAVSNLRARSVMYRTETRRLLDMQVITSFDKPTHVFSPIEYADGTKMKPVESLGNWFSFSLDHVKLELIS